MLKTKNKGFTIIEIVLVLAIAGLIFLMAFVALPALQRSQRDSERKRNLYMIVSAMDYWNQSHNGTVSDNYSARKNTASGFCAFYNNFVDQDIKDPMTGEPYKAGLWNTTRVINCHTGDEYERGAYDSAVQVNPNRVDDSWPSIEIGDIQYDNSVYCDGEVFNDNVGKSSGYKIFAFRIRLEDGGYYCLDNGAGSYRK